MPHNLLFVKNIFPALNHPGFKYVIGCSLSRPLYDLQNTKKSQGHSSGNSLVKITKNLLSRFEQAKKLAA